MVGMSVVQPKLSDPANTPNAGLPAAIPGSPPGTRHVETAEDARKAAEPAAAEPATTEPAHAPPTKETPREHGKESPGTSETSQRGNRNG